MGSGLSQAPTLGERGVPGCPRCPPGTHADDGGDEQQHQHCDVENNDTQQEEEHFGGKFCSAEFLPARREPKLDVRPNQLALPSQGGGQCGGRSLSSRGLASRPPARLPMAGREGAAADHRIHAQHSAGQAGEGLGGVLLRQNFCFWGKKKMW